MSDASAATGLRIELDGRSLSVEDVVGVARADEPVEFSLSEEAAKDIRASQRLKHRPIDQELPNYGVTMVLGDRPSSPERSLRLSPQRWSAFGVWTADVGAVEARGEEV